MIGDGRTTTTSRNPPLASLDDFALENGTTANQQSASVEDECGIPLQRQVILSPLVKEHVERLVCLVLPMCILSVFSIIIVRALNVSSNGSEPFLSLLPSSSTDSSTDSVGFQILAANVNALAIMTIVIFLTYLFVGFFRFRLRGLMNLCVMISFFICWSAFSGYFLAVAFNVMDWLTLVSISLNLSCVGMWAVFSTQEAAWFGGNLYLILLGAILAWPFACLPELTLLFFLIWMAIWDIIAVMTPCGPLRYALQIQQQRLWMAENEFTLPRGMVIQMNLYELGLGDLVFFGVVVAVAATVNYETCVACICAMLTAVILTVLATVLSERTIPALPLAMLLGISTFLASRFTSQAFISAMNAQMVFI